MSKKLFLGICFCVILTAGFWAISFLKAEAENQTEANKGIQYLKNQPQDAWPLMALSANNETSIDFDYLKSITEKSATNYAKSILALTAGGKDPSNFGNENYVEKLKSYFQNSQFGDENLLNDDIWAVLALGSVGQENLSQTQTAKSCIINHQNVDGGWGYGISAPSDTNDTAAALMALLEAGTPTSSPVVQKASAYLKSVQNEDGGFGYSSGSISDSCSDAWVISAIYKLGQDPLNNWAKNSHNAVQSLKSFQDEGGGFWWQKAGDNKFCTSFAVLALLEKSYPVQTLFNLHHLRIEGAQNNICDSQVNGGTAMDLIMAGAANCGFAYTISEYPGLGLYLAKLKDESNWMYLVNGLSPLKGADNYYLSPGDEVIWYSGEWLEQGWFLTKVVPTETESLLKIQVQLFNPLTNNWQNLEIGGFKIKVGLSEFQTNASGTAEIAPNIFGDGIYQVFTDNQVIQGKGYIRSAKEELKIGTVPKEHQTELLVNIEKITVPPGNEQTAISFSVSPDKLDFGTLKPGQTATTSLSIANGPTDIYLETDISGASVFKENMAINGFLPRDFSLEMPSNKSKNLPIGLSIPLNYQGDFGQVKGEITFWAIKK
ncbi:MAG: prenyltransferase/squalene oxidase repeat-containing protein [Candidatus Pacebacteria bacterium]|nr:prenyltransferase/squalene oxidase repeat-containing protein [Candidatus Paceibacterota bacterium]